MYSEQCYYLSVSYRLRFVLHLNENGGGGKGKKKRKRKRKRKKGAMEWMGWFSVCQVGLCPARQEEKEVPLS